MLAVALGAPLFVGLGGAALALFLGEGVPSAAIPVETYRLAVNPILAAIPLFTLAGFALAEGKHASERLLRLFRAFFGWIPGGTAAVTAVLCAFFTMLHRRLGGDHPRARRAAASRRWSRTATATSSRWG